MADMQAELPDSRTSVVGRKRDIQDTFSYRESVNSDDSSGEERYRKRVKETHVSSNTANISVGDDAAIDVSSHLPAQQSSDVDANRSPISSHEQPDLKLSGEEADKGQTPPAAKKVILDPVQGESGVSRPQAAAQSNPVSARWNQAVQSGLRTSFGRKSQSRRATSSSLILDGPESTRQSALPVDTQFDFPMPLDRFQAHHVESERRPDYENGRFMSDGKGSTSDHPSRAENVSAHPIRIQVFSDEKGSGDQEPQAYISELLSHPEGGRLDETNFAEAREGLHHQSKPISSDDNGSEAEESRSDGNFESAGPSTRTPWVSVQSKKFEALTKKARKKLTVPERQAYDEAFEAHQAEERKARATQKAEIKTRKALQNLPNDAKFRKLSKDELDLLDPQKREEYLAALEANRLEKQRRLEEATRMAADILAEGCGIHLPEHRDMANIIARGGTFYPRQCTPTYHNRLGDFKLFEVRDQGKPIHVEQFSFNVFAPAFLANNLDKLNGVTQKMLVSAFQIYIGSFYSHVLGFTAWLRPTATAGDALTLEDAKRRVQMRNLEGSNQANSGLVTIGGDDGQLASHGNITFLPPLSSAVVVAHPGKANTSDINPAPPKRSDSITNLEHSSNRGAEILRNKSSGLGGIHTSCQTSKLDIGPSRNDDERTIADVVQTEAMDLSGVNGPLPEEVQSMDIDINEAELFLQQKYFPSGTSSTAPRCLSCSRVGHNSSTCPALSCTSCDTFGKHSTAFCPLNVRCGKCRERGHSTKDCPEKLARSKGEAIACDMCGSKDHPEIGCHYIWRSYEPKPEELLRVRDIPVHCYNCGASNHYGPECGLHRGRILSGGNTWSKTNLQKYLDPASQQRALSAGIDYSIPSRSNRQFSIKGKANDPIPIDDSDDETFIRAKVNPLVQNGHIRFGRSNEDFLPKRSYENAPTRSHKFGSIQGDAGDTPHYPAQSSQQPNSYQASDPPQGMLPLSMRGSNNGGRGKKGPNTKKGGPAEPGKKKRNRAPKPTRADTARMQNEAKARKRG
jgi:hypothetical protein